MSNKISNQDRENFKQAVKDILDEAKKIGATEAEAGLSFSTGISANVRLGDVETIEFNRDKSIGITIYNGKKKGHVTTSDLSLKSIKAAVEKAYNIAKYTQDDKFSGLLDKKYLAKDLPDLDVYHPWNISPIDAIEIAKKCEAAGLSVDKRLSNSDGGGISSTSSFRVYANSNGFFGFYPSSKHSLSCILIAKDKNLMQRDYDYTMARDSVDLLGPEQVGKKAALKTLSRLGAKKIKTCQVPVIFSANIASSLIGHFLSAIAGSSIYRKSSFLLDHLDKKIFPEFVHIYEDPYLLKGNASVAFDTEGMQTNKKDLITNGILRTYLLSSYSARKLNMQPTGNAGGVHNLFIDSTNVSYEQMLKKMGTGLVVTELMGHGTNLVTGDYSRGACGFWVENGEILHPVEEITIASNLKDMYMGIVDIGNDIDTRGNIQTGSIMINNMTIAGN